MATVGTFPVVNFQGTRQTNAVNIPNNISEVQLVLDGAQMTDPNLRVSLTLDFSPDGGVTWASTSPGPAMNPFPAVATFSGGAKDRQGNPIASYPLGGVFPAGTNRRARAILVVDGAPLNTTITVTAS